MTLSKQPETNDVRLLIARSKWPIAMVRWWCIQELADLITSNIGSIVVDELLMNLSRFRLEAEFLEGIAPIWLAMSMGYQPSRVLADRITEMAPGASPVFHRTFPALIRDKDYTLEVAPNDFESSDSFAEAQGTEAPRIFESLIKSLEERSHFPLWRQFSFEWDQCTTLCADLAGSSNLPYFLELPHQEMTAQFVTRASQCSRSAFVRTLALAERKWGAPSAMVDHHLAVGLPLDPTFAKLRPKRPVWLSNWDPDRSFTADTMQRYVEGVIREAVKNTSELVPIALSAPIHVAKGEIIELSISLWAQWEVREINPPELLAWFENTVEYQTELMPDGLAATIACPKTSIGDYTHEQSSATPIAASYWIWRHGYLHGDLYSRGVHLPLCMNKGSGVSVFPNDGVLSLSLNEKAFGQWQYWKDYWKTSYPRQARSLCGSLLLGKRSLLHELWDALPLKYFLMWHSTRLTRELHSRFETSELTGVIPLVDPGS
jgi:hypothetical protein